MDNKRVLMYVVHHLRSVRNIQFVPINTKKAFSGICGTHIQTFANRSSGIRYSDYTE